MYEPVALDEKREDDLTATDNVPEKAKSKNLKKKKKKKKTKRQQTKDEDDEQQDRTEKNGDDDVEYEIEYVQEEIKYHDYPQFAKVFEAFKIVDEKQVKQEEEEEAKKKELQRMLELKKVPKFNDEEDLEDEKKDEDDDKPKISKRKQKQMTRLSVAELKQCVSRPDVVEMHDVTAKDPKLLVLLKATRNTVPVPRHWCAKRKYLQVLYLQHFQIICCDH